MRVALVACAVLAAAVISGCGGGGGPTPAGPPPNVVVIMTDDQTATEMAALPRTRRLIADAGVSFRRFYVTDPLCCPSRTTFLTGQYAHNHGVVSNLGPRSYPALRQRDTLGPWLERAGYRTALEGKFLNSYGLDGSAGHVPPGWSDWHAALDPGIDAYYDYSMNDNGTVRRYGSAPGDYKTSVIGADAVREVRRAAGSSRPLFMFVAFTAPHAPSLPAPGDSGAFAGAEPPRDPSYDEADVADKPPFLSDLPPLSAGAEARIRDRRERALESLIEVDRQVGAHRRCAAELGTSFATPTSSSPPTTATSTASTGSSSESSCPTSPRAECRCYVRGPGIPAGSSSSALVANVDLAPTILGLADASASVPLDGSSLLRLAQDPAATASRAYLIEQLVHDRSAYYGYPYRAVRAGRYLYVRYSTGDRELYDLERDPFELRNVAGDRRYAAAEASLRRALPDLADCAGESCRLDLTPPPPAG